MNSAESRGAVVSIFVSASEDLGFKCREANHLSCQRFPAYVPETHHLSRTALRYATTASIILSRVVVILPFVKSIHPLPLNL
jgi:hypothetical protein